MNVRNRSTSGSWKGLVAAIVVVVVLLAGWWAFRIGPEPGAAIEASRPAIGPSTDVVARFTSTGGLRHVALEIRQGDRTETLAEETFPRPGLLGLLGRGLRHDATLTAAVGRRHQDWLREGPAVLRAVAERASGPLRSAEPTVVTDELPVRLRPPRIDLVSRQNVVKQGGSGVVVFRVSDTAVRSGVRAGTAEAVASPVPSADGERFVLYGVPWDVASANDVRLFAEDDAGNRAEQPFLTFFKPVPPRSDTVRLSDSFLERVVPAIMDRTPELSADGSLLDQYLLINGDLRARILQSIRDLVSGSTERVLWSGAFEQMPGSARMAGFADRRTYVYDGRAVDHQTHLGLDLASVSQAPVPAANSGRVVFAGWLGIYGNAVILDHGYGLASLYGHLSSIEVEPGQLVARGTTVAHTGATGLAGGDHLHLEIFVHGTSVDPMEWLDPAWVANRVVARLPPSIPGLGDS